jgi:lipopolysaccharide transport system permease protein
VALHTTSLSYPLYVITGTILWSIFIDSVNAPMQQVNAAKPMLAKINFPREALILSGIYQTLFNGSIKISILLIIFMLLGIYPGWTGLGVHTGWALIWFPFGILSLILAGTAIGLLVTPVGMLYTDIGRALQLMMQFLMYLTPVVLPMADIFKLNPITPLILTTRDWLTGFTPEYLSYFLIINSISIALLLAVWIIYRVAMPILIERMSS